MKQNIFSMRTLRVLMLSLMCTVAVSVFTSCENNNEPNEWIAYYVSVESRVPMSVSPNVQSDQMNTVKNLMKDAIHDAYPVQDMVGNDAAVMKACDEAYNNYRTFYPAGQQKTECVLKIYRTRMENEIVRQSIPLKTYSL